jgi:L-serine dehydratase
MTEYSIFDIVGPVMIGPSSSHTAGAARIGNMAHQFAGDDIVSVKFYLHGSFAKTYRGHGTDKALLAGVLGYIESDDHLKQAFEIADSRGISYDFIEKDLGDVHPNSVQIVIEAKDGKKISLIGSSIGGGNIQIIQLNGIDLTISGEHPTIIAKHQSSKSVLLGITAILTQYDHDVLFMSFFKKNKDGEGIIVVEVADAVNNFVIESIKHMPGITDVYLI